MCNSYVNQFTLTPDFGPQRSTLNLFHHIFSEFLGGSNPYIFLPAFLHIWHSWQVLTSSIICLFNPLQVKTNLILLIILCSTGCIRMVWYQSRTFCCFALDTNIWLFCRWVQHLPLSCTYTKYRSCRFLRGDSLIIESNLHQWAMPLSLTSNLMDKMGLLLQPLSVQHHQRNHFLQNQLLIETYIYSSYVH